MIAEIATVIVAVIGWGAVAVVAVLILGVLWVLSGLGKYS